MFVTVIVVCIAIIDRYTGNSIGMMLRGVGAKAWTAGSGVVHSIAASGFFSSRRSLVAENDSLRAQLAVLQEKAASYDVMKDENDSLQGIVRLVGNQSGVTAPVVSSFYASPYGTFMIGAGSEDGVLAGSLVLSGDADGFVIGHVVSASAHRSLVMQTFAPGSSVDAIIAKATVSIEGKGGGNGHTMMPHGVDVVVGDPARSPHYGDKVIGVVAAVRSDPTHAAQDVYVSLPVSLDSISYVYVIPSEK